MTGSGQNPSQGYGLVFRARHIEFQNEKRLRQMQKVQFCLRSRKARILSGGILEVF
jgi:hypothetical protein